MSEVDVIRAPMVPARDWDALEVPEGYRMEIIRGELVVTPAASVGHGRALGRLIVLFAAAAPDGYETVSGVEWRHEVQGYVTMAPQPDLMVVRRGLQGPGLTAPPLLAVEILSPSDFQRISSGMTRREGKLADYGANGLEDYLEVDLTEKVRVAVRYQLEGTRLVEVDRAVDTETLQTSRPFTYSFSPSDLV